MRDLSKFSFGVTSAIITSLALMIGLDETINPKMSIIGALLIIAIADNVSDSLGIHVYRESQCAISKKKSEFYAVSNFLTRLSVIVLFIVLIMGLPLNYAIISSVILGMSLLSILSYLIGVYQKTNPYLSILHHLGIAIAVLIASHFLGQVITALFHI